jgi:hypothetical protein
MAARSIKCFFGESDADLVRLSEVAIGSGSGSDVSRGKASGR